MRINGLNVKKEYDAEPSVETWFKAFFGNWPVAPTTKDLETAKNMAQ